MITPVTSYAARACYHQEVTLLVPKTQT